MTLDSEQIVRKAYQIAEDMDLAGWVSAFTEDGTFTDESIGVTCRGPDELPVQGMGPGSRARAPHSSSRSTRAATPATPATPATGRATPRRQPRLRAD